MTTEEYLRRHFSRMGARLRFDDAGERLWAKIRIDVARDRSGEFFDIQCQAGVEPEVLDVATKQRHMVLMVRDEDAKNKFLLGMDERHWFVAALPGKRVHDVRSAMESLRPVETEGKQSIRQGEWFFVSDRDADDDG